MTLLIRDIACLLYTSYNPERQLNEKRQRLADAEERMERLLKQKLTDRKHRLALLSGRLHGL